MNLHGTWTRVKSSENTPDKAQENKNSSNDPQQNFGKDEYIVNLGHEQHYW